MKVSRWWVCAGLLIAAAMGVGRSSRAADEPGGAKATSPSSTVTLKVAKQPATNKAEETKAEPKKLDPPTTSRRVDVATSVPWSKPAPSITRPSSSPPAAKVITPPATAAANSDGQVAWTHWEHGRPAWQGIERDGRRQGPWVRWFHGDEGQMFSDSRFANFKRPFISTGTFKEGVLQGTATIVDNQGRKLCEFTVVDGALEGRSMWYQPGGQMQRECHYHAGMLEGEMREWDVDGKLLEEARYDRGRKLRRHFQRDPQGWLAVEGEYYCVGDVTHTTVDWFGGRWDTSLVTTLDKEERAGAWTWWYSNGQKQIEGNYQDDVAKGLFTWYFPNAQKQREGNYVAGLPDGLWSSWYANGQKELEGNFAAGEPIGEWIAWTDRGQRMPANVQSQQAP